MHVVFLMELAHRGAQIRDLLARRSALRRGRRSRNLRHRAPRFLNRKKEKGWLASSLSHRVETTMAWVGRLRRLAPISELAQELVRFDTQKLQNPEIEGVEYQRGTLFGFEAGEYLLAKWGRRCAYCDRGDAPWRKTTLSRAQKGARTGSATWPWPAGRATRGRGRGTSGIS
jgi:hypothetical protein